MSQIVELNYPINIDGQTVNKIEMRRPRVKDMRSADKVDGSDADREIRLFAVLSHINPEDLDELDLADYQQLQKAYSDFLS